MELQKKKIFEDQIVKGQIISLLIAKMKCQELLIYVNYVKIN
jgi:hypothetical protein